MKVSVRRKFILQNCGIFVFLVWCVCLFGFNQFSTNNFEHRLVHVAKTSQIPWEWRSAGTSQPHCCFLVGNKTSHLTFAERGWVVGTRFGEFWRYLQVTKKKIWAEGGLGTTTTTRTRRTKRTRTRRTRTRPRKDSNNDHHNSKPTGLWRKHGIDFRLLKPSKWWIANLPDFPSQSLQSDGRQTKVTDSKPRGLRHKAMETKPAGFWRKQG